MAFGGLVIQCPVVAKSPHEVVADADSLFLLFPHIGAVDYTFIVPPEWTEFTVGEIKLNWEADSAGGAQLSARILEQAPNLTLFGIPMVFSDLQMISGIEVSVRLDGDHRYRVTVQETPVGVSTTEQSNGVYVTALRGSEHVDFNALSITAAVVSSQSALSANGDSATPKDLPSVTGPADELGLSSPSLPENEAAASAHHPMVRRAPTNAGNRIYSPVSRAPGESPRLKRWAQLE